MWYLFGIAIDNVRKSVPGVSPSPTRLGYLNLNAQTAPEGNLIQSILSLRLRPFSKVLVIAELLDLLTTATGLWLFPQIAEANPMFGTMGGWLPLLVSKFVATLFVVFIFEKIGKWSLLVWVVPSIAILPVIWNIFTILAEALVYSLH